MGERAPAIRQLPPEVAERIAAGEIVERPASVLKELIENALDAGARKVAVSLRGGGKDLVRVQDDGEGIAAEELPLAVARYATSKLASIEDLWRVRSFGFRGEALASIGQVAELTITSKVGGREGAAIKVSGGVAGPVAPAPCPDGTIVEVRDLFFTVPARRKFLRRDAAEFGRAAEWVLRYALGNAGAGFKLDGDGKAIWTVPQGASLEEKVALFFGPDVSSKLLRVESGGRVGVRGVVARPEVWRSDRRHIYFFLNGRYLRDSTLTQALLEAFRGHLVPGRFPFAVLRVDVDPASVDVNVHPAKAEVRFQDGREVFQGIFRAVRGALAAVGPRVVDVAPRRKEEAGRREAADFPFAERGARGARAAATAGRRAPDGPTAAPRRVLQVGRRYLVYESEGGLDIVDQHALHEKILYRRISERLAGGGVAAQGLLAPVTIRCAPDETAQIEDLSGVLERFGFSIRVIGPSLVAVCTVPALGDSDDPERLLREAVAAVSGSGGEDVERCLAARLACSLAVKSGRELAPEEAAELLAQAEDEELSTCPHGRPTRLRLTYGQLDAHFDRT